MVHNYFWFEGLPIFSYECDTLFILSFIAWLSSIDYYSF